MNPKSGELDSANNFLPARRRVRNLVSASGDFSFWFSASKSTIRGKSFSIDCSQQNVPEDSDA